MPIKRYDRINHRNRNFTMRAYRCGEFTSLLQKYNCCAKIIQKIYRAYRCRRYMNNIYKKLPCDLQAYIIHKYLRRDYYVKKFNYRLEVILNNKLCYYIDELACNFSNNSGHDVLYSPFLDNIINNSENINTICYYIKKYNRLVDDMYIYTMKMILRDLRNEVKNYYYNMFHPDYLTMDNLQGNWEVYVDLKKFVDKMNNYLYS